jgi:AcrR family transcriptional regulator
MTSKKHYATGLASRENILMAARVCFAKRGFFETSMSDIEKAAKTTRGVLYHHFASKDEMILAIIAENLGSAASKIESDLAQLQHTGKGELNELLASMLQLVEEITFGPGKAMSLHVWSLSMLRPEVKTTMVTFFERIRSSLKQQLLELQRLGKIDSHLDVNNLATVLFSIQIPAYIVQRLFMEERSLAPDAYVQSLIGLFTKSDSIRTRD